MTTLILESQDYSKKALAHYHKLGPVIFGHCSSHINNKIKVLVVRLAFKIDENFLASYPSLEAVVTPTTGLNHINCLACENRNIRIFSLADCRREIESVTSTSELSIGLILSLLRRIPFAHSDVVENGNWNRDFFRSRQLSCMTLGILGLGRIGSHVAGYANSFGMKVLGYDPYQPIAKFQTLNVESCSLPALLSKSDIVTIHANLRRDNVNLLGKHELSMMKKGSLLVNTSRGELLDEYSASIALKEGKLGGIAVDVLSDEQSRHTLTSSPFVELAKSGANILITPHIGGCTSDAMHITEEMLAEFVVNSMIGAS